MTLPALTIRAALAGEGAALSALAFASKAHWGYSAEFMAACRDELAVTEAQLGDTSRHTSVAEVGSGQLAGYYALEPLDTRTFDLDAMFVLPEFVGRGVGRALLNHAMALASSHGATELVIQSDPNAAGFYRSAGAVQVTLRESGSIPGRFLPELRLGLKPP